MNINIHMSAGKILTAWKILEEDHDPDGWPAVRMRELTYIREYVAMQAKEIYELRDIICSCARIAGLTLSPLCSLEKLSAVTDVVDNKIKEKQP